MPAINFPSNPSNNELFIAQGKSMRYNAAKNKWNQVGTLTAAQVTEIENKSIGVSSMSVSGNTLVIQKDDSSYANVSLAPFAGNILTNYASASQLPMTNLVSGTQVYVTDTDSLFITDGNGWFKIATVNLSPSFSLGVSSISMNAGGSIDVNYTVNEPEDTPYTISASATSNATITVHQSNNTLTFTAGSSSVSNETITVSATDGINSVGDTLTMTIVLPPWASATQVANLNRFYQSNIPDTSSMGEMTLTYNQKDGKDYLVTGVNNGKIGSNPGGSGGAVVFQRSGTTWSHLTNISPGSPVFGNYIGQSCSVDSNPTDGLVIAMGGYGYPGAFANPTQKGQVQVFTGQGTSYTQTEVINGTVGGDFLGASCLVKDNGKQLYVFRKNKGDYPSGNRGIIQFYKRNYGANLQQPGSQIIPDDYTSSELTNAGFGRQMDGDGTRLIVGAGSADTGGLTSSGAAYMFRFDGSSTWTQETKFVSDTPTQWGYFGRSVAFKQTGDWCAIGENADIPAGYPHARADGGRVCLYKRTGTTWTKMQTIYNPSADGSFAQDSNQISFGSTTLVIGAPWTTSSPHASGTNSFGKAYIYEVSGDTWSLQAEYPNASIPSAVVSGQIYWQLGGRVDILGDYAAIGAPGTNYGGTRFIFKKP